MAASTSAGNVLLLTNVEVNRTCTVAEVVEAVGYVETDEA